MDLVIGLHKHTEGSLYICEVSLNELLSKKYETFEEQRIVNKNHINNIYEEMSKELLKTGKIKLFSEPVILIYKNRYYIVDGQHRMEVFKKIHTEILKPKKLNMSILVKYDIVNDENELRTAFRKTNYQLEQNDNVIDAIIENSNLPTNSEIYKNKVLKFIDSLPSNEDMIKSKSNNPRIPHFTTKMIANVLMSMEDELCDKDIDFEKIWEKTNNYLKTENHDHLTEKQWDKCRKYNIYIGAFPKTWGEEFKRLAKRDKRPGISKAVKNMTWKNHFGDDGNGKCYVCLEKINIANFECGHIVSYSDGGKNTCENMRPICFLCNRSMGKKNLEEFKNEHFKDK